MPACWDWEQGWIIGPAPARKERRRTTAERKGCVLGSLPYPPRATASATMPLLNKTIPSALTHFRCPE